MAAEACECMLRACCCEQEAPEHLQAPTPPIIKIASGSNVLSQIRTPYGQMAPWTTVHFVSLVRFNRPL